MDRITPLHNSTPPSPLIPPHPALDKGVPEAPSSSRAGQRRLRTETHPTVLRSYTDLVCTEHDKKQIAELTHILAKHDQLWFLVHAEELKKKMKPIKERVHVLKILETVFTNPHLKKDLATIFKDKAKRDAVIKETQRKMEKAEKKGNLHLYAHDFALAIGAKPEEIQGFFLRKDWKGLLTHLVKRLN